TATGGTPPLAFHATGLPAWLLLSPSGRLTGTPSAPGAVSFQVSVSDANGVSSLPVGYAFNVTPPPTTVTVGPATLPTATVGGKVDSQLTASGGTAPYGFAATGLPAWLSLSPDGRVTGTPTAAGAFAFAVTATDHLGSKSAPTSVGLTVNPAPAVTTGQLAAATFGAPVSDQLAATGGTGALGFHATGLPAWLSLSTGGLLTGAPPDVGTFPFTVAVTDATGVSSPAADLSLTVGRAVPSVSLAISPATVAYGRESTVSMSVDVFGVSGMAVPSGAATVADASGTICTVTLSAGSGSCSPADTRLPVGRNQGIVATYSGDSRYSAAPSLAGTLQVTPGAPTITSPASLAVTTKAAIGFTVVATGSPVPALSASGLVKGLTFTDHHDGTATLGGKVDKNSVLGLVFTATNPVGSATQSFTLTVGKAPKLDVKGPDHAKAKAGHPWKVDLSAPGYPAPTLSAVGLPTWLTVTTRHPGDFRVEGTPPGAGTWTWTFVATNALGSGRQTYTLQVTAK
ncbi:MAG TPA: putative Ig domain-containing protein, partial [Acidimicrobiales bacterium]|nr:putative Ig domain-containing protein [Acidimicrobiales bacterium]